METEIDGADIVFSFMLTVQFSLCSIGVNALVDARACV